MSETKTPEKVEAKIEQSSNSTNPKDLAKPGKKAGQNIAAIRITGLVKLSPGHADTLRMLHIERKNYCSIVKNTPTMMGMLKKVESRITWGEIDDSTLKELQIKRGKKTKKDGKEVLKPFFRLCPPKGGFERKGIKVPFKFGGALGYRGNKINDLIRRML